MDEGEIAERLRQRPDADAPEIADAIVALEIRAAVRHSMMLEGQHRPALGTGAAAVLRVAYRLGTAGWSGAAIAGWWGGPHGALGGRTPADALAAGEVDAVLAAADRAAGLPPQP